MRMKFGSLYFFILIAIILFSAQNLSAQKERYWGRTSISLNAKQAYYKVVVYQKENISFFFDLQAFKEYCYKEEYIDQNNKRIVQVFQKMEEEMKGDTLFLNPYTSISPISGLTYNFLNKKIRSGNLMIYDRKTGRWETKLIRKNFRYYCGTRCGRGGKKYFLSSTGQEVFEWIEFVN